jgi:hypothetical protein
MISPCSVIFTAPHSLSGGSAASARATGEPPPRPTLPPRPWKRPERHPCSRHTAASASCPSYSAHDDASIPASFPESL